MCPVTLHTLLHLADDIKQNGPLCYNWSFVMEHWCVCVCVFSFVTPQLHDYMAVQQPCRYMWYKGFIIHGLGWYGMQSGVKVLWGFMSGGCGLHLFGGLWVVLHSLSLLLEFQGLPVLDQPSPHLSSVGLLFRFWFWFPVWVGLCLSIAF